MTEMDRGHPSEEKLIGDTPPKTEGREECLLSTMARGVSPNNHIDPKQVRLIHVAKSKLAMADDVYRGMLQSMYHVDTCTALSYDQAGALIDHMKKLGFHFKPKRQCRLCGPRPTREKLPDNVVLLPSRQQLIMIGHLRQDVQWKVRDGYERWRKKYLGIDAIKTSIDASAVIEGLKGLWRSQNPCPVKCVRNSEQQAVSSQQSETTAHRSPLTAHEV